MELHPMEQAAASPSSSWTPPAGDRRDSRAAIGAALAAGHGMPEDLQAAPEGLSLPQVLDIGLRNSPATRQTWAVARAAAAAAAEARAPYYPEVDIGAMASAAKGIADRGTSEFEETEIGPGATLTYLLLDFGGRSAAADAARQALHAANWQHNQQIQDLILNVAAAYYVYAGATSALQAAESSLKEAETSLAATEQRMHVGIGTITDVLQARATLAQRKLDLAGARGRVQIALGRLATTLGLPANTSLHVNPPSGEPLLKQAESDIDRLIATATDQRPDLAAAWATLQARQAEVRQAESAQWPTVNADGAVQRLYLYERHFSNAGWPYTGTVNVTWPVFDGFLRRNAVLQAKSNADAAAAALDVQEQAVIAQVWDSYNNLITATQKVEASKDLLESATRSYDAALASYRAGVGNIVQLLQSESTLASARAEQVLATTEWYVSLAQLAHDTGTLLAPNTASSSTALGAITPRR
jgi:outer membrane protein